VQITSLNPHPSFLTSQSTSTTAMLHKSISAPSFHRCGLRDRSSRGLSYRDMVLSVDRATPVLIANSTVAPSSCWMRHAGVGCPPTSTQWRGNGPLLQCLAQHFSTAESGADNNRRLRICRLTPTRAQDSPIGRLKEPELISPRCDGSDGSTAGIWVSNCVSLALRRPSLVG
jgi:hypothetical protein